MENNLNTLNMSLEDVTAEYAGIMVELRKTLPDAGRELRLEYLRDPADEPLSPGEAVASGALAAAAVFAAPFVMVGAALSKEKRAEKREAALDHAVERLRDLRSRLLAAKFKPAGVVRDVERAAICCLRLLRDAVRA